MSVREVIKPTKSYHEIDSALQSTAWTVSMLPEPNLPTLLNRTERVLSFIPMDVNLGDHAINGDIVLCAGRV